jgi:DNA-binding response OmpR family regulator
MLPDDMIQDVPGATVYVSRSERVIYWTLARASGRFVSVPALYDALYATRGTKGLPGDAIVKVFISHLRKKVPGLVIKNSRLLGYALEARHDA